VLRDARQTKHKVSYDSLPVQLEDAPEYISIVAQPIFDHNGQQTSFMAISFLRGKRELSGDVRKFQIDTAAAQRISNLEQELKITKDNLRQTVTELESVNAELQAANEELQSVNEELYTVNSEYQSKVTELAGLNDDMANFLSTTLVGILMVDQNLNIRKFTEYISDEFNVADQDVGRSLRYIAYNFGTIDLIKQCRQVLKTMNAIEQHCTSIAGKTYLIRIAPYRVSKEQENDPESETEDLKGNAEKNKRNAGKIGEQEKNLRGLVITFVDLTKQVNDEQQLEEISEALRIAAKTSQEKENFLSRMSHDMRTPLTTILGLLELTLTKEEMSDSVRQNLEKMQSSSRYLLSLINEVLETSKLDAGKVVSEYDVVHENDVFEEVNTIIEEKARSAGIHYHFEISNCKNEVIMMDVDHVARILVNLLGNAVKFTERGGDVTLKVDVAYLPEGRVEHTYRIRDTGIGISREFLPKMYLPFEQDSAAQSRNREGTGLGLFISRRLINLLGGTIDCKSEVGKGTEFTVKLAYDLANEDQKKLMHRAQKQDYDIGNLKGKRVLVVEDNQINAEVIMHILEWNGLVADHAENGRNALEKFKASLKSGPKYDAVLMDLRMPVMDGFECARNIRGMKDSYAQRIPIIALSADVYDKADEECYANGMNARVAKPIDTGELFRVLEREIMKIR
jgi:two-component system CheB/CheR fusion protein